MSWWVVRRVKARKVEREGVEEGGIGIAIEIAGGQGVGQVGVDVVVELVGVADEVLRLQPQKAWRVVECPYW